ncbi:MAG: phosphoglycerate dehydrogenase [Chlamydiia bacterium]|nr:phosphoglycerate dehydrogenase [Chlamydiia bacterium]
MSHPSIIIDFDSTFIQCEALDALAAISLQSHPEKELRVSRICELTRCGMEGTLSYHESLEQRLEILDAHRKHIDQLVDRLHGCVTASFEKNARWLRDHADFIHIVSGGFFEFIWPIVRRFGLHETHVHANRFFFDYPGRVVGFDPSLVLSQDGGKVRLLQELSLPKPIVVIGDGMTDYEMRKAGVADCFIAFTENIYREPVVRSADRVAANLDEVLVGYLGLDGYRSKEPPKALLLENIDPAAEQSLKRAGFVVQTLPRAMEASELEACIGELSFLGIRSKTQLSAALLAKAPKLQSVGAFCIGTNQIDLSACSARGISVFNAPYSNTRSVVELALGEMIMLERNIWSKSQKAHHGQWDKSLQDAHELRGKVLGIVGYGKIGSQLSILAEALGMEVLFYDIDDRLPLGNARAAKSLDDLLQRSDIVSVHVDGRQGNQHLINAQSFAKMKKGSVFINLSRGHVVDLEALREALVTGRLKGAAVDVYPKEPSSNDEALASPLQNLPNVILTPHIGGNTIEAQRHIGKYVSGRVTEFHQTGSTTGCVNLPAVQFPPLKVRHRILHLHANVPGMLAKITQVLAAEEINIEAQYLKTSGSWGYVAMDIDHALPQGIVEKLSAIEGTHRVRLIGD